MEGKSKPEYYKCVDICVKEAQRELIGPAFLAICTPILIGFLLNAEALGGFLAGIILSGQLLAVFMANGGGAWDNAKKTIEHGLYGGKGSFCHKAAVIGDTVGDPLKDTSGPALNPLIKVMNLVALLIAPLLVKYPLISEIGVNFNVIIVLIITMIAVILAILRSKKQAFGTGS
jgi:K(+)-stimulated pyrophosphate-energized sodium pump